MKTPSAFLPLVALLFICNFFGCQTDPPAITEPEIRVATHYLEIPSQSKSTTKAQMEQVNEWHNSFEIDPEAQQDSSIYLALDSLLHKWATESEVPAIFRARVQRLQGWILSNEEEFDASDQHYRSALEILQSVPSDEDGYYYEYSYCYNLLANNYHERFQYGTAKDFFRISLQTNLENKLYIEAMKDYLSLSSVYEAGGNVFMADMMIDSAYYFLNHYRDYLGNRNDTLAAYGAAHKRAVVSGRAAQLALYTADTSTFTQNIGSLLQLYNEAGFKALELDTMHNNGFYLLQWYNNVANFARLNSQDKPLIDTALQYANKLRENTTIPPLFKTLSNTLTADILAKDDCSAAREEVQKSVDIFKGIIDKYGYERLSAQVKIIYISTKLIQSRVLLMCAKENQDKQLLDSASIAGIEALNKYRNLLSPETMEGNFESKHYDYYLHLSLQTDIQVEKYLLNNDPTALIKAFTLAEQQRAVLVKQSLAMKENREIWTGKKQELLIRQQELNENKMATLAALQRQKGSKQEYEQAVEAQMSFFASLKNSNSPIERSFYLDQVKSSELNIDEVKQKLLTTRNAIVSFQKVYDKMYVFALTKDSLRLFTTPFNRNFQHLLNNVTKSLKAQESRDKTFAYEFYQLLFAPCLEWLNKQGIKELVLIQDFHLQDLTVEHLPTTQPEVGSLWNDCPMIIDSFVCSYAYSIQSLLAANELYNIRNRQSDNQAHWASFTNLPATGEDARPELYRMGTQLDDKYQQTFNNASTHKSGQKKDVILSELEKADIGQIITHGETQEGRKDLYYLRISQEENEHIYPADVYNLDLKLNLLFLLNCNSGLESSPSTFFGRQSIARAFTYAGTTTTLVGISDLTDVATAKITRSFYEYWIDEGMTAAAALRAAKQQYRRLNPQAHPYMWSQLIIRGVPSIRFAP